MNIKDRIAKLLELADSPNEYEAKAALLKARELMAKYKLCAEEIREVKEEKVINRVIDITCIKMTNTWAARLAAIIAENYCCKSFRNHRHGDKKVSIGFVGLEEDFEICVRIYRYAFECVTSRCKEIKKEYSNYYSPAYVRHLTNSYGYGFCNGLRDAFKEQQSQNEQEWGLVLCTPTSVLETINKMGKASSYGKSVRDKEGLSAEGYNAGKKFSPGTRLEERQAAAAKMIAVR